MSALCPTVNTFDDYTLKILCAKCVEYLNTEADLII